MRIMFMSNSLWCGTGYGIQAKYLLPRFEAMGHQVAQFAFYGLQGALINVGNMPIYPVGFDLYGNDICEAHAEHFKADLVITLLDVWVLKNFGAKRMHWSPWLPIDHQPAPPAVVKALEGAYRVITYAEFGQRMLRDEGIESVLIPHGVDTKTFTPGNKDEAKRKLGYSEDSFLVGMVAANKGYPARKAFPEALTAFARFWRSHPQAKLYLHTQEGTQMHGIDLDALLHSLGIPEDGVVYFCDQYRQMLGFPSEYMAMAYNAMDVLLSPSMSEGFGLPILEAEACGTPVITTAFASMPELTWAGWSVPPVQLFWSPMNSWIAMPSIAGIEQALEAAWEVRGSPMMRQMAREGAMAYDWDRLATERWQPFLAEIEEEITQEKARTRPRPHIVNAECEAGGHLWSAVDKDGKVYARTALVDKGDLCIPCVRPGCEAELRIHGGQRIENPTGFGLTLSNGMTLDLVDHPMGAIHKIAFREATATYHLDKIAFLPGDLVLDIGAHVGVVSLWIARQYPEVEVWAYEPIPENYERLEENLRRNDASNVIPHQLAVTGDGRAVDIYGDLSHNSGGVSMFGNHAMPQYCVSSITLAHIMAGLSKGKRVKVLKLDVEGAEYEILRARPELLERVEYLCAEFHASKTLQRAGCMPGELRRLVAKYIAPEKLFIETVQIEEGEDKAEDA
jgi:FkbM family methyltransferase